MMYTYDLYIMSDNVQQTSYKKKKYVTPFKLM